MMCGLVTESRRHKNKSPAFAGQLHHTTFYDIAKLCHVFYISKSFLHRADIQYVRYTLHIAPAVACKSV